MSQKSKKRTVAKPTESRTKTSGLRPYRLEVCICLALTLGTLLIFGHVSGYDFINFDDDLYVYDNSVVQTGLTGDGIGWAFTTLDYNYWHPITLLSHMLDCELYGVEPGKHHLTSLLLHVFNTLLLFLVLRRLTGAVWRSSFVAALFAFHPLHVESVVWISERKDVLSAFFWLLTIWAYIYYTGRTASKTRYLLVICAFAIGLMAKPMVVTLPFVLLLLDFWPLGRVSLGHAPIRTYVSLAREKIPFFILSALCSVLTFVVQRRVGAMDFVKDLPAPIRIANAFVAYLQYLKKTFWPSSLAILYPYERQLQFWQVAPAVLLLAAVSLFVVWKARRIPYALVGWFWFLGVLLPTIGLVQVGSQAWADRFSYLPLIGLFLLLVWGAGDLIQQSRYRTAIAAVAVGILFPVLGVCSWYQARYWRDSASLFQHTVEVTRNNSIAHNNLGQALFGRGRIPEAIGHYLEALRIDPNYSTCYNNLGAAYYGSGKYKQALACFQESIRLTPRYGSAYYNEAKLLNEMKRPAEAQSAYEQALRLNLSPRYASRAHHGLGVILNNQGKVKEAISEFQLSLAIDPSFVDARKNLAIALYNNGNTQDAIAQLSTVLQMDPNDRDALDKMALMRKKLSQ